MQADGWSSVQIIDKFPDNLDLIVESNPGPDQIAIPLIAIDSASAFKGLPIGIGDTVRESFYRIAVFIYAKSWGQELDLREYISDQLLDRDVPLKDYSAGFPNPSAMTIGPIYLERVSSIPDHLPMSESPALRWGGVISLVTRIFI